jgi:hypothetical protein
MPEYVFFMRSDASSEGGPANHPTAAFEAMTKYNEELNAAGVLLSGDALAPTSSDAYNIKFDGEAKAEATKGPFDVSAENHVTGWWIIKAANTEEALNWAKKCPVPGAQIFFRRVVDASDLGAGYTAEIAQRDAKVRKEAGDRAREIGK